MFLGIRTTLWITFLLFTFFVTLIGSAIYYRHKIIETYLKWKFPNHTYMLKIYYPAGRIRIVWAKVNEKDQFRIGKDVYYLNEEHIHRIKTTFGFGYPILHYYEKSPYPFSPNVKSHKIKMTSHEIGIFKDEELISKLLMVDIGERMIKLILMMSFVNTGICLFLVLTQMGVF